MLIDGENKKRKEKERKNSLQLFLFNQKKSINRNKREAWQRSSDYCGNTLTKQVHAVINGYCLVIYSVWTYADMQFRICIVATVKKKKGIQAQHSAKTKEKKREENTLWISDTI